MYKNFTLTEAERKEILNRHKEHGYKMPLSEEPVVQMSPYKSGQVLQGKRDLDGQMYTIKILEVGQGWVSARIKGPGTYKEGNIDQPLDGKTGVYELNSYKQGKLAGNTWMGEFTIVNKNPMNEHVDNRAALHAEKIANSPKLAHRMDAIVSNLSDAQLAELEMVLDRLDVTSSSTPQEIHNKLEAMTHGESKHMEMPEALGVENKVMSRDEKAKREMIKTFQAIGGGNIAAWGGVPAAMVIGSMTSMPIGFAVSWGVTSILYAAAHAIEKTIDKNKEK